MGPVNKKNRVVSMPSIAPLLLADVKVEAFLTEKASESRVELRCPGRNAYEQLQFAIRSACMMYDVLFQKLLRPMEQSGEGISEGLHAVTRDLPYSTRPIAEPSNSEDDRLSVQDMS